MMNYHSDMSITPDLVEIEFPREREATRWAADPMILATCVPHICELSLISVSTTTVFIAGLATWLHQMNLQYH